MLKIHKLHSKYKLLIIPIASICITFGLLGLYTLTYTPELSHAETVTSILYPPIHPNLSDIVYMQDMTEQVCQNTYGQVSKQLIDKRDGKTYWVTKLKDGNCWMTQNLDLDLSTSKTLTSIDSDVNNWTPSESTQTFSPFGSDDNDVKSWDPAGGGMPTYCNDGLAMSECRSSDNPTTSVNDGHDAQGNYYSWGAATAGQASSLDGTVPGEHATQSICPKGWTLPTGGETGRQYDTLLAGVSPAQVISSPYYFVYNGYAYGSSLYNGKFGYLWYSSSYGNKYALHINYFDTEVRLFSYSRRYYGMPVRCIARGNPLIRPILPPSEDNVKIMVNPTISLDVADEVKVKKNETNPSTADLNVKVSSNQKYSVGISATNPNLTSLTNNTTIPAKSGLLNTTENGWGIKLKDNTNYTALTTSLQTFYTASGAEIKIIPFTIGISTASDLPNGVYSTNITVTATQN